MTNNNILRVSELNPKKTTKIKLTPDAATLEQIRQDLNLLALRKMTFTATLVAQGRDDWALSGHLGATVVQPCTITVAPITTRIEEDVQRLFVADWTEPEMSEVEMPEDETSEPLPPHIDPLQIAVEALTLTLPLYPKADGATLEQAVFTEPGKDAMTDQDANPFAGLSALKSKLANKDGENDA